MHVWIASNFLSNLLIYVFGLHLVLYPLLSDPVLGSAEIPELPARGLSIFADLSGFFLISAFLAALTMGSLGPPHPFFVVGGHIHVTILCTFGSLWHTFANPCPRTLRCLVWSGEAYFSKVRPHIQPWQERRALEFITHAPLGLLNSIGRIAAETYSLEAVSLVRQHGLSVRFLWAGVSQLHAFTFLVRNRRLGASVSKAQAPMGLGKYLMRSPSDKILLGGEMAIRAGCSICRPELVFLYSSNGPQWLPVCASGLGP